jgi:hypothetical protein
MRIVGVLVRIGRYSPFLDLVDLDKYHDRKSARLCRYCSRLSFGCNGHQTIQLDKYTGKNLPC